MTTFTEQQNIIFNYFYRLDVSKYVETKKSGGTLLSYLSWAWAWAEVKKKFPTATYEIERFDNNLPYVYDEKTGYMVFTKVTIDEMTHEMWLPIMDGANKAMKSYSYTYKTRNGEKTVEQCSMFDVNKTIMRCLVKNLAMFGLGLYIYAGEDLPESPTATKEQVAELKEIFKTTAEILKRSPKTVENQFLAKFKYAGKLEDINENLYEALKEYGENGIQTMRAAQENKESKVNEQSDQHSKVDKN